MSRVRSRIYRRWMLFVSCGLIPAFFLGCQESSLGFQQSLLQALAFRLSDLLFAQSV